MKRKFIFSLLLYVGVATAFGQKSTVQVFGVPFGSTYEEFLTAFSEKGFTGKTYIYEGGSDVEVSSIYGTFMTYPCHIEMRATKLTHTVYKIKISFSLLRYRQVQRHPRNGAMSCNYYPHRREVRKNDLDSKDI